MGDKIKEIIEKIRTGEIKPGLLIEQIDLQLNEMLDETNPSIIEEKIIDLEKRSMYSFDKIKKMFEQKQKKDKTNNSPQIKSTLMPEEIKNKIRKKFNVPHPEELPVIFSDLKTKAEEAEKVKFEYLDLVSGQNKDPHQATEILTEFIFRHYKIFTTKDDLKSEMWIYHEGIYISQGRSAVKQILRELLDKHFTIYVYNQVIAKIEPDTFIDPDEFFSNRYTEEIPVKNGILNTITLQLEDFTDKKIFFSKLPVYFDQEAKCEKIEQFLKDILSNEKDILVFYEIVGFCLLKEYTFEKAFMFIGDGRNGKSKSIELVKRLLGANNCCSVPLSNLVSESFSISELYGKMVNMAGDISNKDMQNTALFKSLTGRDLIGAKRKFMKDIFFENYAKLVFACNDLPMVYDQSKGFWDRWVLLDFPYTFVPKEELEREKEKDKFKLRDDEIMKKIVSVGEMSGFLNKALQGLARLIKNKRFSSTKGSADVKSMWIRRSNSFIGFCHEFIEQGQEGWITKGDIRKRYSDYCKDHKVSSKSDYAIKKVLQESFGVVEERVNPAGVGSNYISVWTGIKWK